MKNIILLIVPILFLISCSSNKPSEPKIPNYSYKVLPKDKIEHTAVLVDFKDKINLGEIQEYILEKGRDNRRYVEFEQEVINNGNELRVYSGLLSEQIYKLFYNGKLIYFDKVHLKYYLYNLVPVLIEYEKNTNKMLRILISSVEVTSAFNQYRDPLAPTYVEISTIELLNNKVNIVKNYIPDSVLNTYLIKE